MTALLPGLHMAGGVDAQQLQTIDPRFYHLRTGASAEWDEFKPSTPHGDRLDLRFEAPAQPGESTLLIRQYDVKHAWTLELNGKRLGGLALDESDLIQAIPMPAELLQPGPNTLLIVPPQQAEDIRAGEIRFAPQSLRELFSSTLQVRVVDETTGNPIPARLTLANEDNTLMPVLSQSGVPTAARPGVVYTPTGQATLNLLPGTYLIYAGRGPEYSVSMQKVTLAPAQTETVLARIRREVDTSGWVSSDPHVHTFTFSRHGDATLEERLITLAGETIEAPVAADHNRHVDYTEALRALRLQDFLTPIPGNEVTTARGHFNAFPTDLNARIPDFRILDWPRLLEAIRSTPSVQVVILNHPRDLHSNFRPFAETNFNAVTGENLRGFDFGFDAVELINSGALRSDWMQAYTDWFALLNYGYRVTGVGASDSHDVNRFIVGQGRTYLRANDSQPGRISISEVCESYRAGRALVSLGLFVVMKVNNEYGPGELARDLGDLLEVELSVLGPSWIEAERVDLFANGIRIETRTLEGSARSKGGEKIKTRLTLPKPNHDVHLVAIATGPGVTAPFWPIRKPYQPTSTAWDPKVIGSTNPIWIDADGDGRFRAAREYAQEVIRRTGTKPEQILPALAAYDSAVASQAASLCRAAGEDILSPAFQSALMRSPAHVRKGFEEYAGTLR